MADFEHLQFRGQDVTECRQFIASILKHAFSQGKQRDDQWMADFAATCMEDEALGWWSELDEEVQESWKLLRKAMLSKYRPMFYGGSGEEAEKFIRVVRDKAIDAGKQTDNEWIVAYASSCFAGEALRWYAYLDSDTKDNWTKLEQAVLLQYPRNPPAGAPVNNLPTPAAASPPKTSRRGRIRVSNNSASTVYYLSKYLTNNRICPTPSLANALEVEWNPRDPQALSIPDSQIPGYDILGIKWSSLRADKSTDILALCAVNSQDNSTALSNFSGPLLSKAWELSPRGISGDEALIVSAVVVGEKLFARLLVSYNNVWFATQSRDANHTAEMIFEPM